MKILSNVLLPAIALLLVVSIAAFYLTDSGPATRRSSVSQTMDQRLLDTAHDLASAADTEEEQGLAREALHLADHELDAAFASALRQTAASAPTLTGPLKQLADKVSQLNARVVADQTQIEQLTAKGAKPEAAEQLEIAKAQLALDQDELDEARQDLARQGGDRHATLEASVQAHEAAQHKSEMPAVHNFKRPANAVEQIQLWLALRDRVDQLEIARKQAADKGRELAAKHDALAKAATETGNGQTSQVARLKIISDIRKTQAELDKRIEDTEQLADVYDRWIRIGERRQGRVVHFLFRSLSYVLAIVLAVLLIGRGIRKAFERQKDPRRLHQLRAIAAVAVQAIGALIILMVVFGLPTQTSTIIGLTTAGLTVVLKDFIVAFFGWFALIGKNGVRVGDWVEIEGVSGEVIDIGIFKTVLLEVGNWTSTGHPTGRRVAFSNKFAIEGHYFNFSTSGQWLWDELQITLPSNVDAYEMAEQIRQAVANETGADVSAAEADWERVTRQYGTRKFSAGPALELRPSSGGLTLVLRYITRAPQRYEVKSHLYQAIVELLRKQPAPA